jgi:NADPH2:quinone reductase
MTSSELFRLPDEISFDQAASVMVKGLTAYMLLKESYPLKAGNVVLIHAMMGGVGTLLSDWARALGATVIGTVGSAAKKELAIKRGFEHVADLQSEDFAEMVKNVTRGKGIDVVYDGTGETTFNKSLFLLKEGGSAVLYGWSSGMPVIDPESIAQRKINFIRAALNSLLPDKEKISKAMAEVFDLLQKGILSLPAPSVYSLTEAATAHADLESRRTTGSIILRP